MISSFNILLSGISAAQTSINATSNNISNILTDGFKRDVVQFSENSNGGVNTNVRKDTESPPEYLSDTDTGILIEGSNVSFEKEIASQIIAKHMYLANLYALKSSDDLTKGLMDIVA